MTNDQNFGFGGDVDLTNISYMSEILVRNIIKIMETWEIYFDLLK